MLHDPNYRSTGIRADPDYFGIPIVHIYSEILLLRVQSLFATQKQMPRDFLSKNAFLAIRLILFLVMDCLGNGFSRYNIRNAGSYFSLRLLYTDVHKKTAELRLAKAYLKKVLWLPHTILRTSLYEYSQSIAHTALQMLVKNSEFERVGDTLHKEIFFKLPYNSFWI